MDNSTFAATTGDSDNNNDPSYLVIGLTAGIPCGIIIVVLTAVIVFMMCLTVKGSSEDDQVEATYMHRRFQGLSLAEQRRMDEQKRKKRRRLSRRHSSAGESKASSTKLSPNTRRAKIRRVNPFGLQDWQLQLSGIEPENEETDFDGETKKTVGAFNPLMMRDELKSDYHPDYEPSNRANTSNKRTPPPPTHHVQATATVAPTVQTHSTNSESEDNSDSSDSMNPYD